MTANKCILPFQPIIQTGHNCKTTAIAAVDNFFSKKLGYESVPLHKKNKKGTSIRKISKKFGSVQGELLEIGQLKSILDFLGYETAIQTFDTEANFKEEITSNITSENLIVACFAVNRYTGYTGAPSQSFDGYNEHAAVLHGFDGDILHFTHWDTNRETQFKSFFDSSAALPKKRNPEIYYNVKNQYPKKKYDLCDETKQNTKKSITPKEGTGFQKKLVIIKQPKNLTHFLDNRLKNTYTGNWMHINLYIRCILGILAILTIIPAILVAKYSHFGFKKSFFKDFHVAKTCVQP